MVEMYIQDMHLRFFFDILLGIKPRIFEKLATWAYDMELTIINHGAWKKSIIDQKENNDMDSKTFCV